MKFKNWLYKESSYARVRRILFGDVPNVRTIGIVTAQNPNGSPPYPDNEIENSRENKYLNQSLEEYLRTRNFGPVKIKGKFGVEEDSFLIPNISKEELVKIGQWFEQEAVIWGEKHIDRNNNPYFKFEYIDVESDSTQSIRTVHIGSEDVQGRDDYYTQYKDKKFIIPFFDDPHSTKVPGLKFGTVVDAQKDDSAALTKAESFHIPFFDDLSSELVFYGNVNEITYYSDRLAKDPNTKNIVEQIQKHSDALLEPNKTEKFYWHHRGIIRENMKKLNTF
jgi:hypothetical protein